MKRNDLYKLALGGVLHDIGKVFITKEILEKPGALTKEEMKVIREHSLNGSRYLREKWDIPPEAHYPVLTHHERFDGSGYPSGIREDKIPVFGKIAAVTDVYDALTSNRPYRKAMLPSEAVEHVMGGSGNMFDPEVVDVFLKVISPYPVGTCVLLSNGMKGVVVQTQSKCGTRPKVKIKTEGNSQVYFDLYNDKSLFNITIKEITWL
jgi:HD-GYP domain-containing protein (c-di-GMP phosphodiesterase class II)